MEDYIQKDLELILKATTEDKARPGDAAKKEKKFVKVEKKNKQKKNSGDAIGSNPTKHVVKKRSKTLSPSKLEEDSKRVHLTNTTKSRKSIAGSKVSPSLGKIKFGPSVNKKTNLNKKGKSSLSLGKKNRKDVEIANSTSDSPAKEKVTKKAMSPAVTAKSYKGIDPDAVPLEAIRFEEGVKIEAVDHGIWYKAKIIKVDEEKMDILVHFDGWGSRFDTWFPMTSSLIRGRTKLDVKQNTVKYSAEEDVLAKWSDGNFYPATVLTVKESGSCLVMYFDGMKKLLRPNAIKKMSEKEKEASMKAVQQLLLMPPSEVSSPNSPQSVGSPSSSDGSSFRRYKTSANDREKRISARVGGSDRSTPPTEKLPPRRGRKRKVPQLNSAEKVVSPPVTVTTISNRVSPSEESLRAKKARLDKITHNLLDRVSPTSEWDEKKSRSKESNTEESDVRKAKDKSKEFKDKTNETPTGLAASKKSRQRGRPRKVVVNVEEDSSGKSGEQGKLPKVMPTSDVTEEAKIETAEEIEIDPEKHQLAKNGEPRKEASEALLQLAQVYNNTTDMSSDGSAITTAKVTDPLLEAKNGKVPGPASDETQQISPEETKSEKSSSESGEVQDAEKFPMNFKKGDIVLAKWADCRSYLAYIIRKEADDQYKIQYYDGMIKIVKSSFIHPWVGSLPSALKVFKDRSPPGVRQRKKRSVDIRKLRKERIAKKAEAMKQFARKRVASLSRKEPEKTVRRRSRTISEEVPLGTIQFIPNEKVLAKWTDLKWYPATIVCQTDNDHYQVKYHDNHVKTVRDTWITPWKPPPQQRQLVAPKEIESEENQVKEDQNAAEILTQTGTMQVNLNLNEKKDVSDIENTAKSDIAAPEEGSITRDGDVVGLGEQSWKTHEKFQVGDSVLARWTDCRSYPATVKNVQDDGKYVVEYYDGMQKTLKPDWLKYWNPSALPPKRQRGRGSNTKTPVETNVQSGKLKRGRPAKHDKKTGRLFQTAPKQQSLPRQVVRDYDAYYARLPPETKDLILDNKYKVCARNY